MTPKQILDSFSETLMQDERILSAQERALLMNLLQHARTAAQQDPELQVAVNTVIATAVGETVAQRAFTILGSSIVDRILGPIANSAITEDKTIYATPPGPSPKGPQPPSPGPGVKRPVAPPAPGPQPPAHKPPHKPHHQPLKDVPSGPVPPAHGLYPSEVRAGEQFAAKEPRAGTAVLQKPELLLAKFVLLDEFLSPQELAELTDYTLQHESEFKGSEVITPTASGIIDFEHRRSRVLMDAGKHEQVIVEHVKKVLPSILAKLGMEEFEISSVESQITASNDGDFFRMHPDDGQDEVASRYLTFVYFFHREPRQFEGGELRIHDAALQGEQYVSTGKYQSIVPQQNQIVFFPCSLLHEITSVRCPSQAFGDSRFTLNGWFRR